MVSWSLTHTRLLEKLTQSADRNLAKLLLLPINPRQLQKLSWQTRLERVYAACSLAGHSTTVKAVRSYLQKPHRHPVSKTATAYHKVLNHLHYDWTNSPQPLTNQSLFRLHKTLSASNPHISGLREKQTTIRFGKQSASLNTIPPEDLPSQLNTLMNEVNQKDRQHLLLTAGVAHIQILRLQPFAGGNHLTAILFCNQVLAKYNYAFNSLLNLEAIFLRDQQQLESAAATTLETHANLNQWLKFFLETYIEAQKITLSRIHQIGPAQPQESTSFASLNDRQQAILDYLSEANTSITNNHVATHYKVSPITASRDLSKLKSLGYLTQIGKGRSTTYTKI